MYQLPSNGHVSALPDQSRENDFVKIFSTLKRRSRTFWAIFGVFFAICLVYAFLWPKSYVTQIELLTGNSSQNFNGVNTDLPVLNALVAAGGVQSVETYATLLQDKSVAAQVIQNLGLKHIDAYDLLKYHIYVAPVTNTQIVTLQSSWSTREMSAKIANEFGKVLIEKQRGLIANQSVVAMQYLSTQIPVAQAAMTKADAALASFQNTHVIGDSTAQTQATVGQFTDTATRIAQVEVDQQQAQAALGNVMGQIDAGARTMVGGTTVQQNPVVTQLQQQLSQVRVQLAYARKQYTEAHPTVQALEQQEAQLQKELSSQPPTYVASNTIVPNPVSQTLDQQAASLRSQIAGDEQQLVTLRSQQQQNEAQVRQLPTTTQTLANLQREAQLAEGVYTSLKQHYNDALVAKTLALSDVAVSEPANPRFASVKPSWVLVLGIGLVLGLLLGVSGVFVIDFFDNTLKDEADVARALPAPVLTSIPDLEAVDKRMQARLPQLRAMTIEAYLQLVTAIRFSSDKPLRTLAITSPTEGDGKSTVALSTAIAMAEMRPRVLLVDADMRRGVLHDRLGVPNHNGLSNVVIGDAMPQDVIVKTRYANLDLMPSGAHAPNPVKLIQSARFDEIVAGLLETYQMVIFDTPALLPVIDAAALSAKTDGVVLVVAAGRTDTDSAKRAIQRLQFAATSNILGVVMNRAPAATGYPGYMLEASTAATVPLTGDLEN
ncbi:MAG TPA: polysaccharide biosynthesis tyrosine autokinase [Candidatus Eremiobacteraceae bacterium]|nr:polysaccharide biosynthesis tyrosine autokinase [Candidatus Eremiobacteraceae bacterium]